MSERPIRLTYKTPDELELTQIEFDALAWFVEEFDAGRIVDLPRYPLFRGTMNVAAKPPQFFLMCIVGGEFDCGTAGCILGTIGHRVPHWVWPTRPRPIAIDLLFFSESPLGATARQARDATVRVLRGQEAWP